MPKTRVVFFQDEDGSVPILDWLDKIPDKAQVKCLARLRRLEQLGHELRRPEADLLREGIYELRIGLQGIHYRILYFFHGNAAAVVSHGLTLHFGRRPPIRGAAVHPPGQAGALQGLLGLGLARNRVGTRHHRQTSIGKGWLMTRRPKPAPPGGEPRIDAAGEIIEDAHPPRVDASGPDEAPPAEGPPGPDPSTTPHVAGGGIEPVERFDLPEPATHITSTSPLPMTAAEAMSRPGVSIAGHDPLYIRAIELIVERGRGSCSLLQRALGIGYGRAARMIDTMAEDGILGPYRSGTYRRVLYGATPESAGQEASR